MCVIRAVRVLATVRVGAVSSSTAAISTGLLLVAAVRVATVAAVLVVAGHICRVAVSRTNGRTAGWLDVRDRGWRSLRKLKLTVCLRAACCRQRRMRCGNIIYGLTLQPDTIYGRAGYGSKCWRSMQCNGDNVTAQWLRARLAQRYASCEYTLGERLARAQPSSQSQQVGNQRWAFHSASVLCSSSFEIDFVQSLAFTLT